jgi:SAM-dependent methyltransferase
MVQQEARLLRDDYVLGHSVDEYERLRRQAQALAPVTTRLFHAIGLRPGWRCLDLGCGPGETMRLMGEFVGPLGQLTGLDRDARAGREAIERLVATGTSRYRFIEADMESTSEIGGELFDLTSHGSRSCSPEILLRCFARRTAGPSRGIRCGSRPTRQRDQRVPEARSLLRTSASHHRNVRTLGSGYGTRFQTACLFC